MGSGPGCVQGPESFPGSPGLVPLGAASLGATSNRCPGPTTHRLGPPAGSHELYSMQKRSWGCDPCRLPTASHDANLASWRGISLPVLPFWFLADSDAVSEVLQLCHTPFRSCQVWERFCTGSPSLGAVRRRIWGVAQKPVPSCLALRRCWSSFGFVFGSHLVDIATVALWPLLLLHLACCHHWAQHQGPN